MSTPGSIPDGSRALREGEILVDCAKISAALAEASIGGTQAAMAERCGVQRGILRRALGMDSSEPWAVIQRQNAGLIATACRMDVAQLEWTAGPTASGNVIVEQYLAQLHAQIIADLGPLVSLTMSLDGASVDLAGITEATHAHDIVQIIGQSGTGKTYLLSHLALRLVEAGICPIPLRAARFRGDAMPWLEQSVSRRSTHSLEQVIRATRAAHLTPALLIDAVNETPRDVAAELPSELQRIRNLYDTKLVVTGQTAPSWPAGSNVATVSIALPAAGQKLQLVEAHLGRTAGDGAFVLDAIGTPQDATIWASIFNDVKSGVSRYGYYAAFARKKLGDGSGGLQGYRALSLLARQMRSAFVFTIADTALAHAIEHTSGERRLDLDAIADRISRSGLVPASGGFASFSHEQILTFFAAEDFLSTHTEQKEIIDALQRPVNAELQEFVLGALTRSTDIEAALVALGYPNLAGECLAGHCGAEAQKTVGALCRAAMDRLAAQYVALRFDRGEINPETGRYGPLHVEATATAVVRPGDWLFVAVAAAYYDANLLDHLMVMFAAIDRHIEAERSRLVAQYPDTKMAWRSRMFNEYYHTSAHEQIRTLQILLQGRKIDRLRQDRMSRYAEVCKRAENVDCLSIGQLWFLTQELESTPNAEDPAPDFLYDLAARAWGAGIALIRHQTCHMLVMHARHVAPENKARFVALAESWVTNDDPMINSSVIDVLKAFDALDEQYSAEQALREYEEVLAAEPSEHIYERAFGLYSALIDHPFEAQYGEAYFSMLDEDQRAKFRSLAIQTKTRDSMIFQFLLSEIAQHPTADVIPVLQEVARAPKADTFSNQDAIIGFIAACRGLAELGAPLSQLATTDAVKASWYAAAHIMWHFFSPGQTEEAYVAATAAAWQRIVASHAIDVPMRLLRDTYRNEPERDLRFIRWSRRPLLTLSRELLAGKQPLASIFTTWPGEKLIDKQIDFALEVIGLLGDRSDLKTLGELADNAEQGGRAINAARSIEAR